jgi:L-asparaginase II
MLAYVNAKRRAGEQLPVELDYINPAHPLQQEIIQTFAEMCRLPVEQVEVGVDGCSAPNFAVPLHNAALGYARLCDPKAGHVLPPERAAACRRIVTAMMECPDMVGGPGRFDTRLMEICRGRVLSKGGAEGYQGIGLMPGVLGPGSPAMGIALKIADGDARNKVRAAVTLEVLRQLGALSAAELEALSEFGPRLPLLNWRSIVVGQAYPAFELSRAA